LSALTTVSPSEAFEPSAQGNSRKPRLAPTPGLPFAQQAERMEPKNVPEFKDDGERQLMTGNQKRSTALQAGVQSGTLPVATHLKLVCCGDYPYANVGAIVKKHTVCKPVCSICS